MSLQVGANTFSDAAGNVKAYVPLRIGGSEERFALGVIVPYALITEQARSLLWIILGVGLGAEAHAALLCGTPHLAVLVAHLQAQGWRPGVVSRGHGRSGTGVTHVDADTPAT